MTAIKDIGRTMKCFEESLANTDKGIRPGFMVGTKAEMSKPSGSICRMDSPKISVHIYLDDERREFARAVWNAAKTEKYWENSDEQLEAFFKEQGL